MHSFGNDFIIIDLRTENKDYILTEDNIIYLCDRNYGVGCDQLLVISKSDKADDDKSVNVNVKIFNADGSEALQCGNGLRCISGFVAKAIEKVIIKCHIKENTFITKADKQKQYTKVNMGIPKIENDTITIGNQHKIIIVENFDTLIREPHHTFNYNYVQIKDKDNIFVRTVEKGVGETLSCGSGICASVAYCIQNNLTNKAVKVTTRGSDIVDSVNDVAWDNVNNKPILQGGFYNFIFEGVIDLV